MGPVMSHVAALSIEDVVMHIEEVYAPHGYWAKSYAHADHAEFGWDRTSNPQPSHAFSRLLTPSHAFSRLPGDRELAGARDVRQREDAAQRQLEPLRQVH